MIDSYYKLRKRFGVKDISEKRIKRYNLLFPEENAINIIREKDEKVLKKIVIMILGVFLFTACSLLMTLGKTVDASLIERNEYGEGDAVTHVTAAVDGETFDLDIKIKSRSFTSEEIDEKFNVVKEELFEKVKGENDSLDNVTRPLNFDTKCSDEDVTAYWQCGDYGLIDYEGNILYKEGFVEGTKTKIKLLLSIGDEKRTYEETVALFSPAEESLTMKELLESEIVKIDENNKEESSITLPDSVDGKKVSYYEEGDNATPVYLLALGVIAIGITLYKEKKDEEGIVEERKEELEREYPELVSKLSIYVGAGLSVRKAFEKIGFMYKKSRDEGGRRSSLGEEILLMIRTIESGKTEEEGFALFGDRLGSAKYLRLTAALETNRKNGMAGLKSFLLAEAGEASAFRLEYAKRRGEKISSKLLVPMIMLFAIVLVVLIIPAFMGW